MGHPTLIFGAASFGMDFTTTESVQEALEVSALESRKIRGTPWRSAGSQGFKISTKILAINLGYGSGELESSATQKSLDTSFKRLGVNQVDVLYCHQPDRTTSLKEQARALNEHFKPAWSLKFLAPVTPRIHPSMQGKWARETVCIPRRLQPHKPRNGKRSTAYPKSPFNAFRALAAGFLTGNFSAGKSTGTRFSDDHPLGKAFQKLYGDLKLEEAMKNLEDTLSPLGISGREASLRWIYHHSKLGDGDAIILGASKISQIRENVQSISAGPLSGEVVQKIEGIWDLLAENRGGIF
ncbi:hypothetical protein NHQ30_008587 [Ciborinia camelliae]|nr:hypothetical protein NHQ30_008587 [Ciborinia camelliae]